MIYLLSGLHSPRFADNLRRNLEALMADYVRAVVVLQNGCTLPAMPGLTLLYSEPGLTPFLDTGMAWLRTNTQPGDWFARVDCDDIYSVEYVEGIREAKASGATWSGIGSPYLVIGDGSTVYCEQLSRPSLVASGGSLAGRIDVAPDWEYRPGVVGEDITFCRHMTKRHGRMHDRPPMGYGYQKHPDHHHLWGVPNEVLMHAWPVIPYLQPGPAEEAITRPPVLDSPIEQDVELACSIRHYLTN